MKSVLVVAAHPDDESLGCGGTIAKLVATGATVRVAFLADGVTSRQGDPATVSRELESRREAARAACARLGVPAPSFGDLPDNRMDSIDLLEITRVVEALVAAYQPDTVLTHHAGDLNVDHRRTHEAVVTACRPLPKLTVRRLLSFETASSTEWSPPNTFPAFHPTVFVDITFYWPKKLAALETYQKEMRPWPHPRSIQAVEHLARWRGATAGVEMAEAFMLLREVEP